MFSTEEVSKQDELSIDLVGAGGNGSWMLPMLARLSESKKIRLTVWDDDHIEKKNTVNQNLPYIHLGQPKAKILCDYYNKVTKPQIPMEYKIKRYEPRKVDIVISAVDNNKSRQQISQSKWGFWVDCGVDLGRAYATINTKKHMPSTELFMQGTSASGLACTQFVSPSQNIIAGAMAYLLLDGILKGKQLEKPFLIYNRNNGISNIGYLNLAPKTEEDQEIKHVMPRPFDAFLIAIELGEKLELSWFYRWVLAEIVNYLDDDSGKIWSIRPRILSDSKIGYPSFNSVLKIASIKTWNGEYDLGQAYSMETELPITSPRFSTWVHQTNTLIDPNIHNIYNLQVGGKGATIEKRGPHNNTAWKNNGLPGYTNRGFLCHKKIDPEINDLSDVIIGSLSAYVLYLQMLGRVIDKTGIYWKDNLSCYTRKLKKRELTI